jgi:hypothetical protein
MKEIGTTTRDGFTNRRADCPQCRQVAPAPGCRCGQCGLVYRPAAAPQGAAPQAAGQRPAPARRRKPA